MNKIQCIRGTTGCRKMQNNAAFFPAKRTHVADLTFEEADSKEFFEPATRYNLSPVDAAKGQKENEKQDMPKDASKLMKTACDVKRDESSKGKSVTSFRTVGTGIPQIEVLQPDLLTTNPCLMEAAKVHEEQHVQNSLKACQDFKRCVDKKSGLFTGKISPEDFEMCYDKNHGGSTGNCIADEKSSYEKGIVKAKLLLKEVRCSNERESLKETIIYWDSIKGNAPNCGRK